MINLPRENILAHRGLWHDEKEKNTKAALQNALTLGFGIETDLRDWNENIVLSHDIPKNNSSNLDLRWLFDFYVSNNCSGCLALNIKADGLGCEIKKLIDLYQIANYFIFDMSVPDLILNKDLNLNQFCRSSEFENAIKLLPYTKGVWVDKFNGLSYEIEDLRQLIEAFPSAAIVSPELHGSSIIQSKIDWHTVKQICTSNEAITPIFLCTDFPEEAYAFINGKIK